MDATIRVAEVPASRGMAWIGESFKLFRAAPATWLAICAAWLVLSIALMIVPIVGAVASNFLQPVFFASFAVTAYKQQSGERISVGDLWSGFRHHVRELVNLGALLLLVQLAIIIFMVVLGLPTLTNSERELTMQEYVELLQGKEWILAIGFLMMAAIRGLVWFAAPLITFHGMSTSQAMRWSLYAFISNIGAMMVYGTVLLGLFMVAIIPWALGLVLVIPLAVISTYVGYREVFETPAA
jgi:uncharacterized membrane protein